MPTISELPDATVKLLGSPLVITTPTTLVKELLDNAIDAKATSVEVRVSLNTIDKIEVKDNGVGIHPDDYDSLGRRGHTSKLRTFEELSTHGCKTLGFRGEALAAANTLAQVSIITKTADDPVGATLQLLKNTGGIERQQKVSAPVGTTVRIAGLFGRIPVREQVAIRESAKTLDKIRDLLKTYAMARPSLKLSLIVLQNPSKNWSYSPNQNAGVKEAILQVAGREVAANCIENIHHVLRPESTEEASLCGTTTNKDGYTFEAYIMDPNGDPSKVPKYHYFSVDGRPIATERGAMKKILEKYVKAVEAKFGHQSDRQKGYFIRLNIVCPQGSYDANVEPSKDEVLFVDEKYLLDTLENLWQGIYNPCGEVMSRSSVEPDACFESHGDVLGEAQSLRLTGRTVTDEPSVAQVVASTRPISDMCLLDPRQEVDGQDPLSVIPPRDHRALHQEHSQSEGVTTPILEPMKSGVRYSQATPMPTSDRYRPAVTVPPQWKVNMSTDLNEYVEKPQVKRAKLAHPISDVEDTVNKEESLMQNLNPWIIAKMNASACPQRGNTTGGLAEQMPILSNRAFTPPTPEPPILRHLGAPPGDLDLPPNQRLHMEVDSQHRGVVPGGPYRSPMSSPLGAAASQGLSKVPAHHNMILRHRRPQPPWTPPCSVPRPTARQEQEKPPKSRLNRGPDGLEQTRISFKKSKVAAEGYDEEEPRLRTGRQLPTSYENDESGSRDDFEAIFSSARQHLHQQLPQSISPMVNSQRNETRNHFRHLRSTSVQCNAQPPTVDKEPIKTIIPSGDPRAYLLRRQKSIGAEAKSGGKPKFRRLKSSMLPLENIPEEEQTHLLVCILQCKVQQLRATVQQVQPYDKYMIEGELEDAIDMDLSEGRRVESRLKALLLEHGENNSDRGNDVELDLSSLLKGKGRATGI